MKTIVALFLACFATALFGQGPPIQRNYFTTNQNPSIVAVSNTGLQYISPPLGNNGTTDAFTNAPLFKAQIGVAHNTAAAGGEVYMYGAYGAGLTNWGTPWLMPGNVKQFGAPFPYTPYRSLVDQVTVYLHGNPNQATYTNMINPGGGWKDTTFRIKTENPWGYSAWATPVNTTNIDYNIWGAGTYNNVVGTNVNGIPIFEFDHFGLTGGTIAPGWLGGNHSNQAGANVLILGGRTDNPFHLSENYTYSGIFFQYPFFTYDRRGQTNNYASPVVVGFPKRIAGVTEPTQANWQWTLVADERLGTVSITNGLLTTSNVLSIATNTGAIILGGNYYSSAVNNFNGKSSFQLSGPYSLDSLIAGFDVVNNNRIGFVSHSGQYPSVEYAAGAMFQINQSSASDLIATTAATTYTNMFRIDGDRAAFHTTRGLVVSNRITGAQVVLTNGAIQAISVSTGNGTVTNQVTYLPRLMDGRTNSFQIDLSIGRRWIVTNVTGLSTNVTFQLTNVADGNEYSIEFDGNSLGTNFTVNVTLAAGGTTTTNIDWQSPTNGNFTLTATTNQAYKITGEVAATPTATNIVSRWGTTDPNPVRGMVATVSGGQSPSNAVVGGLLYKAVALTAATNLNSTIATFSNALQYIVSGNTMTNTGDSITVIYQGTMKPGTNAFKWFVGYETPFSFTCTNGFTAWELRGEITRTASVGAQLQASFTFLQTNGATPFAMSGLMTNMFLNYTNGAAVTNVLQLASSQVGSISNNVMKVIFEPSSR